jgi:mannose-6-phosphate isomerase-like protein (cupin superfamily)
VTDLDRAYLLRSGESVLPGRSEYMRVLVGGEQSAGQYAWLHYTMDHDAVPHVHEQEDESVYLIEGEITVHIGPDSFDLGPGDFIFMPRQVPHAITVRSGTYRGMSVSAPGGVFDSIIRDRSAAKDAGQVLDDEAQWRIREKYGMHRVDSLTEGLLTGEDGTSR